MGSEHVPVSLAWIASSASALGPAVEAGDSPITISTKLGKTIRQGPLCIDISSVRMWTFLCDNLNGLSFQSVQPKDVLNVLGLHFGAKLVSNALLHASIRDRISTAGHDGRMKASN